MRRRSTQPLTDDVNTIFHVNGETDSEAGCEDAKNGCDENENDDLNCEVGGIGENVSALRAA